MDTNPASETLIGYTLEELQKMGWDSIVIQEDRTRHQTQATLNKIHIQLEDDLENPVISCEQNQLKQVFINLLKNAMESMQNGGEIIVKVKRIKKDMISIRFIDEGVGISEKQIPRLGEPFYTTKADGTGLGLMVCYRIIESHGGYMKISSKLQKGTIVEVCLPNNHHFANEEKLSKTDKQLTP